MVDESRPTGTSEPSTMYQARSISAGLGLTVLFIFLSRRVLRPTFGKLSGWAGWNPALQRREPGILGSGPVSVKATSPQWTRSRPSKGPSGRCGRLDPAHVRGHHSAHDGSSDAAGEGRSSHPGDVRPRRPALRPAQPPAFGFPGPGLATAAGAVARPAGR